MMIARMLTISNNKKDKNNKFIRVPVGVLKAHFFFKQEAAALKYVALLLHWPRRY